MNEHLTLTKAGADLIKHFESCLQRKGEHYAAYVPSECLTIGWGHTNHHGRKFDETLDGRRRNAMQAFLEDMEGFERDVRKAVKVDLTSYQFDALVSFTYNVRSRKPQQLTLLKKVNAGDFEGAAKEFTSGIKPTAKCWLA